MSEVPLYHTRRVSCRAPRSSCGLFLACVRTGEGGGGEDGGALPAHCRKVTGTRARVCDVGGRGHAATHVYRASGRGSDGPLCEKDRRVSCRKLRSSHRLFLGWCSPLHPHATQHRARVRRLVEGLVTCCLFGVRRMRRDPPGGTRRGSPSGRFSFSLITPNSGPERSNGYEPQHAKSVGNWSRCWAPKRCLVPRNTLSAKRGH